MYFYFYFYEVRGDYILLPSHTERDKIGGFRWAGFGGLFPLAALTGWADCAPVT